MATVRDMAVPLLSTVTMYLRPTPLLRYRVKVFLNQGNFMKLTHILSGFFLIHILSKEAKMFGKPHRECYSLAESHI